MLGLEGSSGVHTLPSPQRPAYELQHTHRQHEDDERERHQQHANHELKHNEDEPAREQVKVGTPCLREYLPRYRPGHHPSGLRALRATGRPHPLGA